MTDTKQEFLNRMRELYGTNRSGYIAMLSILCIIAKVHDKKPPAGYSRGDFKRGIRALREIQGMAPYTQEIEAAIALIRREWLHREAAI